MKRQISALIAGLWVASACAQTAPLNLKLPPSDVPASSATTTKAASTQPGVYYGDTSGKLGNTESATVKPQCDDSTFNKPQTHGSVSTGIATGSHMGTSTFNAGTVNIRKQLGSCDDPGSTIDISIGVSHSNGDFGRYGRYGR